jgi:hypothetical protein
MVGDARRLALCRTYFAQHPEHLPVTADRDSTVGRGVLIRPSLLGELAPRLETALFPKALLPVIYVAGQLGLVALMFQADRELRSYLRPVRALQRQSRRSPRPRRSRGPVLPPALLPSSPARRTRSPPRGCETGKSAR